MEQLENKMILDEYWGHYNTDWDKYYEAMAEKEDMDYEDNFEEGF